jgi:pimeloyl-ACP methyl ester carboxylesterase
VFVAASVDPELESNEGWFRVPLSTPFLRWILPRSFRASNDEIVGLKWELQDMLPDWKNIHCPVVIIQGTNDNLVPAANADFAKKMLVNAPVEMMIKDGMNHFVPWNNPGIIEEAILNFLSRDNSLTSPEDH